MSMCICMYPSHRGPTVEVPCAEHRESEEEREVKSQSRALQEVFGTEARVKIHS